MTFYELINDFLCYPSVIELNHFMLLVSLCTSWKGGIENPLVQNGFNGVAEKTCLHNLLVQAASFIFLENFAYVLKEK